MIEGLSKIMTIDGAQKAGESLARLEKPISTTPTVIAGVTQSANNVISNRMTSNLAPALVAPVGGNQQWSQVEGLGVAAGDEEMSVRSNAWVMPLYNQAMQKARKGTSGYKVKSSGGIAGVDYQANDTLIIGAAVSVVKTDVKHKDLKVGDKTKVDMQIGSVYAVQAIDRWVLQGVASVSSGKVKNSEKRIIPGGAQIAAAKYDSMSYSTEVIAGYNCRLADTTVVTPMIGISYNQSNDSGYTETGTTYQNLSVSKKSSNKSEVIIGSRVSTVVDASGVILIPEVHTVIRQALGSNKPAKMNVRLDGLPSPLITQANKPAKTFGNVGVGMTAKSGRFECGIGYDATFANKYIGHQGILKLKVGF